MLRLLISFFRIHTARLRDNRGDGDSFWVVNKRGRELHLRLLGMDAPEFKQPLGVESSRRRRELLTGLEFKVRVVGKDCYGRKLAKVTIPGKGDLGKILVSEGMAHAMGAYRFTQFMARVRGRGVWGLSRRHRVNPGAYRKVG